MSKQAWTAGLALVLATGWMASGSAQVPAPAATPSQQLVDSLRAELHAMELEMARKEARWQAGRRDSGYGALVPPLMTGLVFIALPVGIFTTLILRQANQRRIYLAAIERGVPVPLPRHATRDARRPALLLIALGVGYAIAVYVTISLVPEHGGPAPLAASIWGVLPVLVGAALWLYHRIATREQAAAGSGAPGAG